MSRSQERVIKAGGPIDRCSARVRTAAPAYWRRGPRRRSGAPRWNAGGRAPRRRGSDAGAATRLGSFGQLVVQALPLRKNSHGALAWPLPVTTTAAVLPGPSFGCSLAEVTVTSRPCCVYDPPTTAVTFWSPSKVQDRVHGCAVGPLTLRMTRAATNPFADLRAGDLHVCSRAARAAGSRARSARAPAGRTTGPPAGRRCRGRGRAVRPCRGSTGRRTRRAP